MTVPDDLHWIEPDAGCAACGKPYLTVDDHRCGECIEAPVGFCPLCLGAIGSLIDREVVRRVRAASGDVNEVWVSGRYLSRLSDRQRVDANRAAARARWAS
jgi:hypothetical protein